LGRLIQEWYGKCRTYTWVNTVVNCCEKVLTGSLVLVCWPIK
jgi:hypothetical protein